MKTNMTAAKIPHFNYGISPVYANPGIATDDTGVRGGISLPSYKRKDIPYILITMTEIVTPNLYSVFALCKLSSLNQHN